MAKIGKNLSTIHRLEREYLKPILDEYHLPANAFSIILNIGKEEGLSQKQLCERIGIDEALITRLVHKLEDEKIIMKKRNTDDLRAYQLYLTDLGKEILPKIENRLGIWWKTLLEDLPQDLLEQYIETITQRAKQLTKEDKK